MKTYKANLPEIQIKYKSGDLKKVKITSSDNAAEILREMFNADTLEYSEEFIVVYLNRANNTIGWQKISSGGMNGTVCDKRMIFATALKVAAHSVLLAHNHPSGQRKPSTADINLTKDIVEAGKFLDISVLDHIILTDVSHFSFLDDGLI